MSDDMHSGLPSDSWGPWGEVKLRYVNYNIRQGKAKPQILKLNAVFYHLPSVGPKQLCALAHLGGTLAEGISK